MLGLNLGLAAALPEGFVVGEGVTCGSIVVPGPGVGKGSILI